MTKSNNAEQLIAGLQQLTLENLRAMLPADFPTIVTLCGSTRFGDAFRAANLRETIAGKIVLSVGCDLRTDHELWAYPEIRELRKKELDVLHLRKIDLSSEVLILNVLQPWCPSCKTWCNDNDGHCSACDVLIKMVGYIGTSTRNELAYARSKNKVIRYLSSSTEQLDG